MGAAPRTGHRWLLWDSVWPACREPLTSPSSSGPSPAARRKTAPQADGQPDCPTLQSPPGSSFRPERSIAEGSGGISRARPVANPATAGLLVAAASAFLALVGVRGMGCESLPWRLRRSLLVRVPESAVPGQPPAGELPDTCRHPLVSPWRFLRPVRKARSFFCLSHSKHLGIHPPLRCPLPPNNRSRGL